MQGKRDKTVNKTEREIGRERMETNTQKKKRTYRKRMDQRQRHSYEKEHKTPVPISRSWWGLARMEDHPMTYGRQKRSVIRLDWWVKYGDKEGMINGLTLIIPRYYSA